MEEMTIDVCAGNIEQIMLFVNERLESFKCSVKALLQINIVMDELFGNAAFCTDTPQVCVREVSVKVTENPLAVIITFHSLSEGQDEISGLGSYIAEKCMDEISYEYINGQHILTLMKHM